MTNPFIVDLNERKRHVRHYLAVVMYAERSAGIGTATASEKGRLLTLRAGTFLILYNLIEATVRGAVEAIHDSISAQSTPFEDLTLSLRSEVVRRFRARSNSANIHAMADFSTAFVSVALNQEIKIAGSLDAKAIREIGECYGFSCKTNSLRTRDGSDLLTIKRNRNDLAHGIKSFEEVGRDFTSRQLVQMSRRTICYMTDIVSNISAYLDNDDYLEKPRA